LLHAWAKRKNTDFVNLDYIQAFNPMTKSIDLVEDGWINDHWLAIKHLVKKKMNMLKLQVISDDMIDVVKSWLKPLVLKNRNRTRRIRKKFKE
jgi:hypothetical protein